MNLAPIFLLACNLLNSPPGPAPVSEAPASEPIATPEPCPHGEQVHQWLDKRYPNIPTAAYNTHWDGEACTVEIPEHKQLYRLTCSESGCEEVGADPTAKETP